MPFWRCKKCSMPKRVRGPIVIVGAGLTGGTAAKELRKQGYAGELLILAEEPSFPFGRPPLTKGYLRGEEDLSGWMVAPPDWYKAHQIQLVPARVSSVDPAAKQVQLESGDAIGYARLLLATGGRNRRFDVPGSSLQAFTSSERLPNATESNEPPNPALALLWWARVSSARRWQRPCASLG